MQLYCAALLSQNATLRGFITFTQLVMVSTSVFIIFALSFISFGSGYHIKKSGYSQVIKCINDAFVEAKGLNISEEVCYYKVRLCIWGCTMVDVFTRVWGL